MRRASWISGLAIAALSVGAVSAQTIFPLTLDNCSFKLEIERAPQRVVTIKSTATEMLLALGLGDRIVGVGFQDGPLPTQWDSVELAILSPKLPSQEVVLETEPDLVYGGWESNFVADGAGERASLRELGVGSYVSPAACRSVKPPKLTFQKVFEEIREVGGIFDAQAAADKLIAQQQAELETVRPDNRKLTAIWYSSGTKTPYVGAGSSAPAMMMEALGLQNIMADQNEGWISASWEAVVDADPDVIILVDAEWNSAEQKKELLAENPITSKLSAVVHQRYIILPFPASEAGVRNASAVVDMGRQLAALDFDQ